MDEVLFERQERVGILTLNRPEKRNSISPDMLLKMSRIFDDLSGDDEIRTMIIRGAGNRIFSAGYDISSIPTNMKDVTRTLSDENPLEKGFRSVMNYPYPVIAMLNGSAIGAGCELSLCCDLRIARDDIQMGMPPAKLGVLYLPNGIKRFIQTIGISNTKKMFFTGRMYRKEDLKEMGLVDNLVPGEELESFTFKTANEIASNAPISIKGTKRLINIITSWKGLSDSDLVEARDLLFQAYCSADLKEGQKAFLEKRKPVFTGK